MSGLGKYTPEDFADEYPVDFGSNVRGSWFDHKDIQRAGLVLAHIKPDGEVCAGTVWLVPYTDGFGREHPYWEVVERDPLTLSPSIECDCGLRGFIESGRWHT